jgi:hypothetical protein
MSITNPTKKTEVNLGAPEEYAVPAVLVKMIAVI